MMARSIEGSFHHLGCSLSSGLRLFSFDRRTFLRVRDGEVIPSVQYMDRLNTLSSYLQESKRLLVRFTHDQA